MKRVRTALALVTALAAGVPAASAAVGRRELKVYFQSNLTDAVYQKRTFERVAAKWKTPPGAETPAAGKKTVVQAVIDRDGKLVSAVVSLSSGKKGWDDAALKAVASASPLEPLPAGFKPRSVEVHFHVSVVP